jgi:TPR repeat protein
MSASLLKQMVIWPAIFLLTNGAVQNARAAAETGRPVMTVSLKDVEGRWAHVARGDLERAATSGNPEAQYYLGATDFARAYEANVSGSEWVLRAEGPHLADVDTNLVKSKWGDKPEGDVRKAAEAGDREAMYFIGMLGQDRAVADEHKAAEWVQRAAEQGLVIAQYRMGGLCFEGGAANSDPRIAAEWFRKAALAGHEGAQHRLALLLLDGNWLRPDYAEAVEWLRKAADQGCPHALYDLARQYSVGNGEPRNSGDSIVALLRQSAKKGFPEAQFSLADHYRQGLGVPKDYISAIDWYRRAYSSAENYPRTDEVMHYPVMSLNDPSNAIRAQVVDLLDALDDQGDIDPTKKAADPKLLEVFRVYRRGNDFGQPEFQQQLGEFYEKGVNVKQNFTLAVLWYSLAAEGGNAKAAPARDHLKPFLSETNLTTLSQWMDEYHKGRNSKK